jgi:hypothetical protein
MSKPYTESDIVGRINKGKKLLQRFSPTLVSQNPEIWTFPSETKAGLSYAVSQHEGLHTCTCQDYRYHGGSLRCKHICAVMTFKGQNPATAVNKADDVSNVTINVPAGAQVNIHISTANRWGNMAKVNK